MIDKTYGLVRYEKRGHVAYITLDRPRSLNALNLRMHESLARIWDDFESDANMWIGVLSGVGDRAFSVGQDLKEMHEYLRSGGKPTTFGSRGRPGFPRLTERLSLEKPLIARINGLALGGGFELALACDIIIAAEHASFALPEARLGMIPGAGGLFRLTRQIPSKIALGCLLAAHSLDAKRAYELGLVNEVVPAAQLDACVSRWVEEVLACAPLSIRAIKQVYSKCSHLSLEDAFVIAADCDAERARSSSEDCLEGVRAFAEGRPPKWRVR